MRFSEKINEIFLDNIGHRFETSGWIFFYTKTNIMCQILSRSDVLKEKVGCKSLLMKNTIFRSLRRITSQIYSVGIMDTGFKYQSLDIFFN